MRSNYRPIGEYITPIKLKNVDLEATELLGINIDKFFMPSVANVVGTDLSKYKVVKKGQFACNRMHVGRDYRIPIALSDRDDPFIVSPAYDVFEITRKDELLDEYLMMWFSRPEFDRNAWFHTDADVRGGLPWNMFCSLELPVPSIEKQREIVKEYNSVVNRIKLNEQLNQKLEETSQALYKHWFVDFNFPITEESCPELVSGSPHLIGKPYKSSGGKMVWNQELGKEIPEGWNLYSLGDLINYKKGNAFKSSEYTTSGVPVIRVSDLTKNSIDLTHCYHVSIEAANRYEDFIVKMNDIIITTVGSWPQNPDSVVGKVVKVPSLIHNGLLNQNMVRLRCINEELQLLVFASISRKEFSEYVVSGAQGSANQASVTLSHLFSFKIILPDTLDESHIIELFNTILSVPKEFEVENTYLRFVSELLLSKMTQVEVEEKEEELVERGMG